MRRCEWPRRMKVFDGGRNCLSAAISFHIAYFLVQELVSTGWRLKKSTSTLGLPLYSPNSSKTAPLEFSFVALKSRRPRVRIRNYCFCNATERDKRPGESHESVAEKKQDSPAGANSSELSVHVPPSSPAVALMAQLVWRHSLVLPFIETCSITLPKNRK